MRMGLRVPAVVMAAVLSLGAVAFGVVAWKARREGLPAPAVPTLAGLAALATFVGAAGALAVDLHAQSKERRMASRAREVADSGDHSLRLGAENGGLAEAAKVVDDLLAARQKAELDLIRAREGAVQAARVKSQFLANVSHELRTPLNGIIGLSRIALDTPMNPELREFVISIRSSGQTLLALVNDILDLSKVEAGRLTLEKIPFELAALLDETLVPLRPRAEERGLRFDYVIAPGVPAAFVGDPLRLRQVLTNLAGNSLKFTLQGFVRIQVSPGHPRHGRPTVHFAVADTGIGIPSLAHGHVFEAFSQADTSTTRKFGGTGLGLTISRQIVELMGGNLVVDSKEGEGSTFSFEIELPVHSGPVPRESDTANRFPHPARRLKILLADDNPVNRLVGQKTLEKLGHGATVVADGEEAVQTAAKASFDVILLDIQMPGVDGFEALRRIRARESELAFRTPVLALTAHAMPGASEASIRAGFDGHLVKPLDPAQLAVALRRAVAPGPEALAAPSTTPTATAVVRGELLRHFGNDEALLTEIIGVFLRDSDETARNIRASSEAGDLRRLADNVHRLNGSLRTLGAKQAATAAAEAEQMARDGRLVDARGAAAKLLKLLDAAVQELSALVKHDDARK